LSQRIAGEGDKTAPELADSWRNEKHFLKALDLTFLYACRSASGYNQLCHNPIRVTVNISGGLCHVCHMG
jgi:hypothetical protein